MRASQTHLVPLAEMTPGMIATIRNSVIEKLVSMASKETGVPEEGLVVRDILPYTDLGFDYSHATAGTNEGWRHEMTSTTPGYLTATGATTMADQRFVAIFGIRDGRAGEGATHTATNYMAAPHMRASTVSLIKFEVGGAIRAIWDIHSIGAYFYGEVGFAPGAVIIPQNIPFEISFYTKSLGAAGTAKGAGNFVHLQMLGVTVEPRGLVVSP